MALQAGQMLAGLALLALQGVALWLVVEGIYWIYCKARGRSY
jgi:hypothetical protein